MVTVKQQLRPIGRSVVRQYLPLNDRKGQAVLVLPDLIDSSARVVTSMANDQGSILDNRIRRKSSRPSMHSSSKPSLMQAMLELRMDG